MADDDCRRSRDFPANQVLSGQYRQGDIDRPVSEQHAVVQLCDDRVRSRRSGRLLQGIDAAGSRAGRIRPIDLATTLDDARILAFAQTFNFAADGASTTQSSAVRTNVVNQYISQSLDTAQGQQNPGVQLALYFQQNASGITNSYDVLANENLLTVVQTALGLSPYTSQQPIDEQARQLSSKIDFLDFQNPTKVQSFVERFCAMYDLNNSSSSGSIFGSSSPPANAIEAGRPAPSGSAPTSC